MVKLVYFAWVRERIGKSQEDIDLPENVTTISDLIAHLRTIDEGYDTAFQEPHVIRAALDKTHSLHDEAIGDAKEIAFFPPMTGG
ncbi:MAG: molybdopterin converting factor subunit 1 [Lentilitoribacter sp.]